MRVVDLSHPIRTAMQVFPGDPEVRVSTVATLEADGFQVAEVHAGTHTGTHLDAPLHSIRGGASVDVIALERLVGAARIIACRDLTPHTVITWEDVADQVQDLDGARIVLFRTDWSECFGSERYLEHPVLTAEIADRLLALGVDVVGVDTLNPDATLDNGGYLPFHAAFLGAGGVIIENLTNLADVTWPGPLVSLLPLPLDGADGAPIRAVALRPDGAPGT
jgi:kynurenine formamidase